MMNQLPYLTLVGLLLIATPVASQVVPAADPALATVVGVVLDPARDAPLAGAHVFLFGTSYGTTTDGEGGFRIDAAVRGPYVVAFEHASLQALGIEAPRRLVMLAPGEVTEVDLRVPVAPRVAAVASLCPSPAAPGGIMGGAVIDPESGVRLPGARIRFSWLDQDGAEQATTVVSDGDGTYLACGLPMGTSIHVQARLLGALGAASSSLTLGPGGLALRDLALRSGPGVALASLAGELRDSDTGQPIAAAQVRLPSLGRQTTTDASGRFFLPDVAQGRHELVIEHLAYGNRVHQVEVTDEPGRLVQIRLPTDPIALGTLEVVVHSAAEAYRRSAGASVRLVTRADIERRAAVARHAGDLIRTAWPGVFVQETGNGLCVMLLRGMARAGCVPIFVDGVRVVDGGLYLLDLPVDDIESVEFIPPTRAGWRYGTVGTGGVLEVWSRGNGPFAERRQR